MLNRTVAVAVISVFAIVLWLSEPLLAQVGTATLSGSVTDPSGSVVPKAAVKLESIEQRYTRQTVTDISGIYVLSAIPPGNYQLSVSAAGFRPETFTSVGLSSGQASTLNVPLRLTAASEQVTVIEAPALLQTSEATVGSLVQGKPISELPLLGGNFTALIRTLPGIVPVTSPDSRNNSVAGLGVNPSLYGQRQRDNNFTMDGGSNNDLGGNDIAIFPPPDAIAEMKVQSGMTSGAFGHASGANINIVTKAGTKDFHGTLWEFWRNNILDARSFFVPQLGAFRWNQFGGAVGGPILIPHLLSKDKGWYFFGYYEGTRISQAANYLALIPTADQLSGNLAGLTPVFDPYSTVTDSTGKSNRQPFPNNQIPANRLNASGVLIAKTLYPSPNLPTGQIPGVNFINVAPTQRQAHQESGRVDHQFSPNDSFFVRWSQLFNRTISPGLPAVTTNTYVTTKSFLVSETHIFNPSFLVTARFGVTRWNRGANPWITPGLARSAGTLTSFPAYTDPSGNTYEVFPGISIPGYAGLSNGTSLPSPETQIYWDGDFTKIHGGHTIGFGGMFHKFPKTSIGLPSQSVSYDSVPTSNFLANTGIGLASFLLGLPSTVTRTVGSSDGILDGIAYAFYVQDTYRVYSKLTINLGLRYDYTAPLVNRLGSSGFTYESGQYFWNKTNPVTGQPANVSPGVLEPDRTNFAPRFGIAFQLSPKTVIRSGFAMFYDSFGSNYSQTQQGNRGNWPFAGPETLTGINTGLPTVFFPNPFPGPPVIGNAALGIQQNLNAWPATSRMPYVEQWTFSVQRQITNSLVFEAVYFGSHGVKLDGQIVDNTALAPGSDSYKNRQKYPQLPPYVSNGYNIFPSYYEGMSLKLEKRFSRNFMFDVNYTWSKNIDYNDSLANNGSQSAQNPTRFNIPQFKGLAGFDTPVRLALSYIYELPVKTGSRLGDAILANWSVSGITTVDSGLPYSPIVNFDNANIGSAGRAVQFPNVIGKPNINDPTPNLWFNTAAFGVPPAFTFGNAGRNFLRADGFNNWDFSIFKRWPFHERKHLELRGESFNLLNNTTFGYPGNQIQTPQFGKVNSTRNSGRSNQLALKFQF
jgi:Carboxypeptidase regulatory-like domain